MTQHYPTTSAVAAVWTRGLSFPVSAMLLIYTYSLLPASALSKTLLYGACCRRETKRVVDVLDISATCGRFMTKLVCPNDPSDSIESRPTLSSHWYCDDVRLYYWLQFTVARHLIFELIWLILVHFVRRITALSSRGRLRAPAGTGIAPPLNRCSLIAHFWTRWNQNV